MLIKKRKLKPAVTLISAFMIYSMLSMLGGCSSDSTPPTTTTPDANVVSFDSVDIYPSTSTGIDLYLGKNVNSAKDLTVIPTSGLVPAYYFQSGHLSGGFETGLTLVDSATTKSNYESISSVASWGAAIDSTIFLSHFDPQAWGTLANPNTINPVYGFYLQRKHANGTTSNKIYGLIYVNSVSGGHATPVRINISIRYNKAGLNKF